MQWAWYTGPLVEPFVHEGRIALDAREVASTGKSVGNSWWVSLSPRLLPAAVSRLSVSGCTGTVPCLCQKENTGGAGGLVLCMVDVHGTDLSVVPSE